MEMFDLCFSDHAMGGVAGRRLNIYWVVEVNLAQSGDAQSGNLAKLPNLANLAINPIWQADM